VIEPIRILTQRRKGEAHAETLVTIDWTGITQEELYSLARNALIHDMQARFVKDMAPIPEKHTILACVQVHKPSPAMVKYTPPPPKPTKMAPGLDELLANLSQEEIEILLGSIV
jgi:hypothetical protein